MKIRKK